jgi:hypothetical protein
MSLFYCTGCDNLCDGDDGCDEDASGLGLICVDCMDEREAEADGAGHGTASTTDANSASGTNQP